jgi:hypothetical protein
MMQKGFVTIPGKVRRGGERRGGVRRVRRGEEREG